MLPKVELSLFQLGIHSAKILEFAESRDLTLAETVTVLDSATAIARAKLTNMVGFASMIQMTGEILNGPDR